MHYNKDSRNKMTRYAARGYYDHKTVYSVLDSASVCQVGFEHDGQVFVIPMAYGRHENHVYLHGSVKSRFAQGGPVCINVTLLDGLVLAKSAFHSSMNYRSAVVFGEMVPIEDREQKLQAMQIITDHILPGRWSELRMPTEKEIDVTAILAVEIQSASAKIRTGNVSDDPDDADQPVWAGVVPINRRFEKPISAKNEDLDIPISQSVLNLFT